MSAFSTAVILGRATRDPRTHSGRTLGARVKPEGDIPFIVILGRAQRDPRTQSRRTLGPRVKPEGDSHVEGTLE